MFKTCIKPPLTYVQTSGSFNSQYANLPLKSCLVNIPITQQGSGTPSPDNIRDFIGFSGVNISRTGKNLLNPNSAIIPHTTYGFFHVISANIPLIMSITDNDTSVDLSGVTFGFALALTEGGQQPEISSGYKWIVSGGTEVASYINNSYLSSYMNEFAFYPRNQATLNKIFARYNIQVEYGEQATAYEPYNGQSKTFNFGQTVYVVNTDILTGKSFVTHILKTIDENSNIQQADNGIIILDNFFEIDEDTESVNCNVYQRGKNRGTVAQVNANNPDLSFCCKLGTHADRIMIKDTRFTTLADYQTWLSTNPVKIAVKLAEPIVIPLGGVDIKTLLGFNNIFSSVGNISAEFIKFGR